MWYDDEKSVKKTKETVTGWFESAAAHDSGDETDVRLAAAVDDLVDRRLQTLFAAALADPDVTDAKSLAGYLLEKLSPTGGFGDFPPPGSED